VIRISSFYKGFLKRVRDGVSLINKHKNYDQLGAK